MRACYGTSGVIVVVKTGVRAESIPPAFGHGGFCGLNRRSELRKEKLNASSGLDTKSYEENLHLVHFVLAAGWEQAHQQTDEQNEDDRVQHKTTELRCAFWGCNPVSGDRADGLVGRRRGDEHVRNSWEDIVWESRHGSSGTTYKGI